MTHLLPSSITSNNGAMPIPTHALAHHDRAKFNLADVCTKNIHSEPSFRFKSDTVTIRLFEKSQTPCKDFSLDSCDKIIIPYSKLEMSYSVEGNATQIELLPGQGFFIPSQCNNIRISNLLSSEFIMFDINETVRTDLISDKNEAPSKLFERASMLPNAQHLLKFANTARRLLLSPMGANLSTVTALGVMAAAETLASLRSRAKACANLTAKMVSKLDSYISDNIEQSLQLKQLADICHMSTPHFSRTFKSATGKSPYQYILERRITYARQLLKDTADSIADIAYGSGFSSQSHMTELFRKNVGITPAKYRGNLQVGIH